MVDFQFSVVTKYHQTISLLTREQWLKAKSEITSLFASFRMYLGSIAD